jgi:hypothetical protein
VHNKLDESTEKLRKMVEKVEAPTANCMQTGNRVKGSDGPKTYASTAKTNIPTALSKIIAKNEAQARQILIDRWSLIHVNSLCELTEAQLVAKAAMAVELMAKMVKDTPKDLTFISTWCLPHGGVLYELNSLEMVAWFNTLANQGGFLEYFGPEITINDRAFHVLVENVPISFIPENQYALADIKKKVGLKPGSIAKA